MSTSIDERIVEMQFNNKQFETGIKSSMNLLDKLKTSLKFEDSVKGITELQNAGKNFSLSALISGVETVSNRFTNLGIIGVTALQNITNSAVNAGKQLVSSFTIDPIKTGFQEYETQINAIQTILANTSHEGTKLEDVNAALDELNLYADKTIYNFTEMTKNIGTFTAAGVDLETSVSAIKGIANLAALSGSTSQQASTVMYQLSQAIAAGTVTLEDWNSVVNAGMGGKIFQDSLKETARLMGKTVDETQSFRNSISSKDGTAWLTSDVLLATLEKFTGDLTEAELKAQGYTDEQTKAILQLGDTANAAATEVKTFTQLFDTLKESVQSGWTQTWEILIGDFEEAKGLLSSVSDYFGNIINESSNARNQTLEAWKILGGREDLLAGIKNTFEGILGVIQPIQEAFRNVFPPITFAQLDDATKKFKELSENFKISDETAKKLRDTFEGVFSLFSIGIKGVSALAGGFFDLLSYAAPMGGTFLDITSSVGVFIKNLDESIDRTNLFENIVDNVVEKIIGFANSIKEIGTSIFNSFTGLDGVSDVFSNFSSIIENFISIASSGFDKIKSVISNFFKTINFNTDTFSILLGGGVAAGLGVGIKKIIDAIRDITEGGSEIIGSFQDILGGVKNSLEEFQNTLKSDSLIKIATALGILTISIVALSSIDPDKLINALTAMAVMVGELIASLSLLEKVVSGTEFKSVGKLSVSLLALSTSLLILSAAVKNLSELSWDELAKGLEGVAVLSLILVTSAKSLSKSATDLTKISAGLIIFSVSINILTSAVEKLGSLNVEELTKGLIGVGILCAELVAFLKTSNFDNLSLSKGIGLMTLATSLLIMTSAVSKLSSIDIEGLIKGLTSIGILLGEVAAFTKIVGNGNGLISTATGMTIIAASMIIFSKAVENFGKLSWTEIAKGLVSMAGALSMVALSVNLLPKNMISSGTGLLIISAALLALSKTMDSMGGMSWEDISKSIITLASSLSVIAIAMNAMKTSISGAASLLIISGALAVLAPVLKSLGSMSLGEIATSLIVLAGSFAIFGAAGMILSPVTPVILALSAAIALFGAACLGIGVGVAALSAGFTTLAVSGAAGAASLVVIINSLLSLIPVFLEKVGEGIIAFAGVITNGAPAIMQAITAIGSSVIESITILGPQLIQLVITLLTTLLQTIAENAPMFIESGLSILISFMQGIADNIQQIVELGITIITEFINGISSQLPTLIQTGFDLIISFIDGLASAIEQNTGRLVDSIMGLAGAMVQGLIDGLTAGISSVGNAVLELGSSALNGLKNFLGIHSPSTEYEAVGTYSIQGYANGVTESTSIAVSAITQMANAVITRLRAMTPQFTQIAHENMTYLVMGFNQALPEIQNGITLLIEKIIYQIQNENSNFRTEGKKLISSLLSGMKDMQSEVIFTARSMIEKIVGEISSRSDALYDSGRNLAASLADGLRAGKSDVIAAANELANAAADAVGNIDFGGPNHGSKSISMQSSLSELSKTVSMFSERMKTDMNSISSIRPVYSSANFNSIGNTEYGLNAVKSLSIGKSINNAVSTARSIESTGFDDMPKYGSRGTNASKIEFNQYNYSPKALSRIEIYRQTKNQLSVLKGKVVDK